DAGLAGERRDPSGRRSARMGGTAGILAWFAVGCPVCNKIALIALGYTGALTWFAPLQPYFAGIALVLSVIAVVWLLRGQVSCPLPTAPRQVVSASWAPRTSRPSSLLRSSSVHWNGRSWKLSGTTVI